MAAFASRIGGSALAATAALMLSVPRAQAGYVVTLEQVGSDVVATGSGALDLVGLTFAFVGAAKAQLAPSEADITTGPVADTPVDGYDGFSGPANFGGGGLTIGASGGSGDSVTIVGGGNLLAVPQGYLSGGALSDTSTYDNQTFDTLGITPGAYTWTWGSGANQNFTVVIGEVPEPATWAMMLIGFAVLGYAGYRKAASAA
jgi:hypothetical protein